MKREDPKWVVSQDMVSLSHQVLKLFLELYRRAVSDEKRFTVLLSGGKTPDSVYFLLAESEIQKELNWSKIHLFWGDERFVPPSDPESNFGAFKKLVISRVAVPITNIHPIETDEPTPELAARKYEEHLKTFFKLDRESFPQFDLIFLGVGEDGHTASLFPGTSELNESRRWVVPTHNKTAKNERVTVTLPLLNAGKNIAVLAAGETKSAVLKRVFCPEGSSRLPIQMIRPFNGSLTYFLDQFAASFLK
jgi:6-phosphogluconolactonase